MDYSKKTQGRLTLKAWAGCAWALFVLGVVSWLIVGRPIMADLFEYLVEAPICSPSEMFSEQYDPGDPVCDDWNLGTEGISAGEGRVLIVTVLSAGVGGLLAVVLTSLLIWKDLHNRGGRVKNDLPEREEPLAE